MKRGGHIRANRRVFASFAMLQWVHMPADNIHKGGCNDTTSQPLRAQATNLAARVLVGAGRQQDLDGLRVASLSSVVQRPLPVLKPQG